jgi:hypothetical protein
MDKQTRISIYDDIKKASKSLLEILDEGVPNLEVVGADYLTPLLRGPVLPLDHERSSIQYYSKILEALKETLMTGICPVKIYHAPSYLQKLFK